MFTRSENIETETYTLRPFIMRPPISSSSEAYLFPLRPLNKKQPQLQRAGRRNDDHESRFKK